MKTEEAYKMNVERRIALSLLNAVWNEDLQGVKDALDMGASPSWIFNGYPILLHAVCTKNKKIVNCLINAGALQTREALGFALEKGIGEMIPSLAYRGIVPKHYKARKGFGDFPQRFAY